ncbi:MAG: 2-amino-4-hydroxy-6-hydroxymethyldihydropteridine diphosphokinase [Magnetococcales bacterium]|nr:2-amino-4-hydroxy-6-hydroxymethyldihydropteridine diphosphokinase [Magnetococcales bacterium]
MTAWIGLGANLGKPQKTLTNALKALNNTPNIQLRQYSNLYRSEPVGSPKGVPWYLNGVCQIETTIDPHDLLNILQKIEASQGRDRTRETRWGARTLDLDLLLYGNHIIDTPTLIIPHPRWHLRRFVLHPLAELAPELIHPLLGKSVDTLCASVDDPSRVIRLPKWNPTLF